MPAVVHFDPVTGLYVNPVTGAASTDPAGQNPADPGLTAQAHRNLGISNQLLGQLATFGQQYQNAQTGENQLGGELNQVIAGTAPSVAQAQLQQGLGQIQQAQQSDASGATGTMAALARMNAQQNTGQAQAQMNQQQALVRAGEVAAARQAKAGLLANQANQAGNMYGQNLTGALGASGQAGTTQGTQAQIQAQEDAATKQMIANLVAGGGAAAATIASGGRGRGAAAA